MARVIELTDEEYAVLAEVAKQRNKTPEEMLRSLVCALAALAGTVYCSAEEMFAALEAYAAEVGANCG